MRQPESKKPRTAEELRGAGRQALESGMERRKKRMEQREELAEQEGLETRRAAAEGLAATLRGAGPGGLSGAALRGVAGAAQDVRSKAAERMLGIEAETLKLEEELGRRDVEDIDKLTQIGTEAERAQEEKEDVMLNAPSDPRARADYFIRLAKAAPTEELRNQYAEEAVKAEQSRGTLSRMGTFLLGEGGTRAGKDIRDEIQSSNPFG
jgi:hypothetical protein